MTFPMINSLAQLGGRAGGDGPEDLHRALVQRLVQEAIQAEFDHFIGAGLFERTEMRRGWCNGSKPRTIKTRVGKLVLRISKDRAGRFHPSLFARRSSTRKSKRGGAYANASGFIQVYGTLVFDFTGQHPDHGKIDARYHGRVCT